MAVNVQIRDGARFSSRIGSLPQQVHTVDVTGLAGGTRMLYDAYRHPQFPREGTPHPTIPNFFVFAVDSGEMVSATTARFSVVYEERPSRSITIRTSSRKEETPEGLIQIGASLTTVETQRDKDGVPLTVTYTPPGGEPNRQFVKAELSVPNATRRIERIEMFPDLALSDEFTGTVNAFPIWGRDSRTLIVTELQFSSRDGGATWNASYEFQYRPETWDTYVNHETKETGEPTEGITLGNGIERKRLLRETDFSKIGVRFPSR
jgi:hypothetical protein